MLQFFMRTFFIVGGLFHGLRTPNEAFFSLKSRTFGLGQTNWADKFWGIWVFAAELSAPILVHKGSPLSMFSIIQPLFLHKTKPLFIWDWDLNLGGKELGI